MSFAPEKVSFLIESIKSGSAMLVLGAGASFSSKNAAGLAIKQAGALAALIAAKAGLPYDNEMLTEVLTAVNGILSEVTLTGIYSQEYKACTPSDDLQRLFSYSWRRIYTWCIDDTLENLGRRSVQRRVYFNGMNDKVVDFEGFNVIHIVSLHGQINKPEHRFIMTERDYSAAIKSDRHFWYQRLAQDYLSCCPVFIGSRLAEPILFAELERAKREGHVTAGRGYLVTPDELTPIQSAALESKGIIHLRGTLESFSQWLQHSISAGWSPTDIMQHNNNVRGLSALSADEISSVEHLREIVAGELQARFVSMTSPDRNVAARYFLTGHYPTWEIASSEIPVQLDGYSDLFAALQDAIKADDKLFIVSGQAGSGKTTALMVSCLQLSSKAGLRVFELNPNVRSVSRAISFLKVIRTGKIILYIGDLFVYGDNFVDDLDGFSGAEIMIVSTVRSGEWNEHFSRYLGSRAKPYQFQRFSRADYEPLIERLISYVPSPKFRRMAADQQIQRLATSRNQLMIALREATESERFDLTILNEYKNLPDRDTKLLFTIVGLATLARVGIGVGAAREAYSALSLSRPFAKALDALAGIVSETTDNRLLARHDVYVRHVFDAGIQFDDLKDCIKAILRTFLKFNIPVIKSVKRLDSSLFKSLINHNFIYSHANRHRRVRDGVEVYEEFEVDFQLDGHFWLQYGLFLASIGKLSDAITMLRRSIIAYPGNPFAVHALADLQLRSATDMKTYDSRTKELIDEAVSTLLGQDAQSGLVIDRYPIVTLALGHIGALVKHGDKMNARDHAKHYFDRIQEVQRHSTDELLQTTQERLLMYLTHDEWPQRTLLKRGSEPRSRSAQRRRSR